MNRERLKPSTPGVTEINAALQSLKAYAEALMIEGLGDDEIRRRLKARMGTPNPQAEPRLLDLYDAFLAQKVDGSRVCPRPKRCLGPRIKLCT